MKRTLSLSRKSSKKKGKRDYIDYSEQVVRDLPLFFSRANRVKEGLNFFLKEEGEPKESVLKMANYSKEGGQYQAAAYLYNYLLQYARENEERKDALAIMISQLELFVEFKKNKPLQKNT